MATVESNKVNELGVKPWRSEPCILPFPGQSIQLLIIYVAMRFAIVWYRAFISISASHVHVWVREFVLT